MNQSRWFQLSQQGREAEQASAHVDWSYNAQTDQIEDIKGVGRQTCWGKSMKGMRDMGHAGHGADKRRAGKRE